MSDKQKEINQIKDANAQRDEAKEIEDPEKARLRDENARLREQLARFQEAEAARATTQTPELAKLKSLDELQEKFSIVQISSPSCGGTSSSSGAVGVFNLGLAVFWTDGKTLCVKSALEPKDMAWANQEFLRPPPFSSRPDLFDEENFYSIATSHHPSWSGVEHRLAGSEQNASSIFNASLHTARFRLPWACKPEFFARAKVGHPGFNGELKSTCTKSVFEQVATYVCLDIMQSLFGKQQREGKVKGYFYDKPPIGYGLVAFPHVGYFIALEWVGILHITPITQPFFLGSDRHGAAVASLCDDEYEVYLDGDTLKFKEDKKVPHKGFSLDHDKKLFHKVIFAGTPKTDAEYFRNLYRVYTKYSSLSAEERPSALLSAKLLFGQDAVMVEMELFDGRHAKPDELSKKGHVSRAVAEAVVWLAAQGLLYCDIRPPNILVCGKVSVALVDYDDLCIVDPISNFPELDQMMSQKCVGWGPCKGIREHAEECFAKK